MQGVFEFYRDLPLRPKLPERLFFGLFPDAATSRRVAEFRRGFLREHSLDGAPLKAERLHVSLHHVGDYKRLRSKLLYAAQRAGTDVSMRPFEVTFRVIKSFEGAPTRDGSPRRRPLVLLGEGDALFELHKRLGIAMERNGLRATPHFTPHMTLLYGPKPAPAQAIEPISCTVDGFALIHSERGARGTIWSSAGRSSEEGAAPRYSFSCRHETGGGTVLPSARSR